jgi:hypothetical protein
VNRIGIIFESDASIWLEITNVNVLIHVDYVFPLGIDFDQNLFLSHGLDDFPDVGSRLLQMVEFLAEHAYFGVECVAIGLEAL